MTLVDGIAVRDDVREWKGLVVLGAWAALASVVLIVVQIGAYALWPPPETTVEFFEMLVTNPLLGLWSLDGMYIVSNLMAFLVYLGLAVVLWRVSHSAVVVALGFGTLGMAAYMASPRPVEMLSLAHTYFDAGPAQQVALVATGDGMLATWMGTAFDIYYFFNLITLLVFAVLMYRSAVFTRATAIWGLVAAMLMAVPSNFGTVGLVFALASLIPWAVFAVLVARRLLSLSTETADHGRVERPSKPATSLRSRHVTRHTS